MEANQYKELFASEAKDILSHLNKRLVYLEKQPNDKDCLNEIFRQAHTLKGMAATMGYEDITKLTHEMESVLDLLRQEKLRAEKNIVDLLFNAFDVLEKLIDNESAEKENGGGEKTADLTALTGKLEKITTAFQKKIIPTRKNGTPNLRLEKADRLEIIEKEKQGFRTYHVVIRLTLDCALKEPRAFVIARALQDMGKIIRQESLFKQLAEGKFDYHFELFLITREHPDLVIEKIKVIQDVEDIILNPIKAEDASFPVKSADPAQKTGMSEKSKAKDNGELKHEAQMVKVPLIKLDNLMDAVGELVINKLRLKNIAKELQQKLLDESLDQMSRLTDILQAGIVDVRLVPMDYIFNRFPRLVRDLAAQEKKEVDFIVEGADIGLDRTILDEINTPLVHLLKNSVAHGIELPEERKKAGKNPVGKITLSARRERAFVVIEVSDDGIGIDGEQIKKAAIKKGIISEEEASKLSDEETFLLTTSPGFSTSKTVTEASGRGVGMNSVKTTVESFGGSLAIESKINEESRFILKLPLSMAIIQALLVKVAGETYAIPLVNITETIKVKFDIIKHLEHHEVIPYRDEVLPLIRLTKKFGFLDEINEINELPVITETKQNPHPAKKRVSVVVVEVGRKKAGLVVDKLLGQQEVVIKTLAEPLKNLKGIAGATILGDGKVALIADVAGLV